MGVDRSADLPAVFIILSNSTLNGTYFGGITVGVTFINYINNNIVMYSGKPVFG